MSATLALSRAAVASAAVVVVVSSGCTKPVTDPDLGRAAGSTLGADAAPHGDSTASSRWSAITRDYVSAQPTATNPNPVAGFRAFAYVSLAQYRAVVAADEARGRPPSASPQGAVAAASAAVLSALFPADTAAFAAQLRRRESEAATAPANASAFATGEALGREVGAGIADLARPAPAPRPYAAVLDEGGGSVPSPPPPAFGSPAYLAALAEVRRLSDTRTADQLRIAQFWALTTGSLVAGFWNEESTKLIERYHLDERRAALALVHMAMMDATIACYDAKYTYWLIRPYRADPAITTAIPRPNHPSFPSAHACGSGAAGYVLGGIFPTDAARLAAMADEAGESRLYAGIHYRFDKDAALGIARQVAALALAGGDESAIYHPAPGGER